MSAPAAQLHRIAATAIRKLCIVPELLSVTEWADKYRVLPETSTSPGPYNSAITPYARVPQDLLGDPATSMIVLCWAAQTTKSTVLENGLAYRICRMPSPMLVVLPKIDAAEAYMKERFTPMTLATPALRNRVRLGRAESTMRYKTFPGGFLFAPSAQSATELASRSAPFIELDEVDRYEAILGEGNPAEIVLRRQGAADVGCAALTSTPKDEENSIIWPYLIGGTFERYHVPCPHCGELQPLVWKNEHKEHGLRWDKGKPETAHYVCGVGLPYGDDERRGGCGTVIEHASLRWMMATEHGARWVAQNPDAPYRSFHLPALYSPFAMSSWAKMAREFEKAKGKPADLQVFVNTWLAETWKETAGAVDASGLLGRLERLEKGVVPTGVGRLTAGVDVQGNRLEVYVWGWGADKESWLVYSEMIPGDPEREADQPGSVWARLDAVLAREYPHEAGGKVSIAAALVDSGFAATQVYRYTRKRKGRRIYASKGVGGAKLAILGSPTIQGKEKTILYPVGVDSAKSQFLRSQILESKPGPGYVHLPDWMDSEQAEQLVAEKLFPRATRRGIFYEWRLKKAEQSNEALDCRNYARAALELLGSTTIAQLGALAEELTAAGIKAAASKPASKPSESPSIYTPPKPPRRGNGWVGGWK